MGESLNGLELIPLAHRVMVERALAAAEQRVVHAVRRRGGTLGAQFVRSAGRARSQRIRLVNRVVVKGALVLRQARVARCPRIREARRSSSPSAAAIAGPPIMAAATRKPRPK